MKPSSFISLLFLVFLMFTSLTCRKINPEPDPPKTLPPITQEGKNTFGCLVNGEVWLPKGSFTKPGVRGDYYRGSMNARGEKLLPNDGYESVGIAFFKLITGEGKDQLP